MKADWDAALSASRLLRSPMIVAPEASCDPKVAEKLPGAAKFLDEWRRQTLALYHSLGELPEPESTHDFF
jgi:hypothetical protein